MKANSFFQNDLNNIERIYKNQLKLKNITIEKIKTYQNNYIEYFVKPKMDKINKQFNKDCINNRIKALEKLVNNLK